LTSSALEIASLFPGPKSGLLEQGSLSMQLSIDGIYETHLPVADLARSVAFYRDILGLELAAEFPERGVAFFWAGGKSTGMLGLWASGNGPLAMRLHFAFRTSGDRVAAAPGLLRQKGIAPLGFHGEPVTEPVVIGWVPALSLYFKDPDGHMLELIAILDTAPDPGFGIGPHSAWQARHGNAAYNRAAP
jgi:lactoylglutathione lyase